MEWKRNILRKAIIVDESKVEVSNERCTIHNKKSELINTSIQETGISSWRMAGESNQDTNETFSEDSDMNLSYLQNAENLTSDEGFGILHAANSNGGNMEGGDDFRMPRSTETSVHFDENSSFLVSELDNSSNCNENNNNIVSEKFELDYVNEDKENDVRDIGSRLQTADTLESFDENLDFSVSKLSNFQNHIENNKRTSKDTGNIAQNKMFKSPAKSLKKFKKREISKFHNLSRKKKKHCRNDNFAGTSMETKLDNPHEADIYGIFFANKAINEENMTKYRSEINVCSKSYYSKIPVPSRNMTTKSNVVDSKSTEVAMKDFHNEKDPLSKQNDIKNNMKYDSCITHFENGMRRGKLDKEIVNRSVTDLVTYFESLNTLKQSNVKSKVKKFESKQRLKRDYIIKANRIINSITSSSPPTLRISKIGSKTKKLKGSVPDDISSETSSGDTKEPVAKQADAILHHVNSGDGKRPVEIIQDDNLSDVNLCDRKISIDEKSPENNVTHLNTDVRKKSIHTIPENIPFDFNIQKCENVESPMAKLGICAYCEGKCVHCEPVINHTEDHVKKIKEHVFLFSDDKPKQTRSSIISNTRRCRSRFTRTNNPVYQQSFRELDNSKKDIKSISDFNKTEESRGFLNEYPSETSVKICLSDSSVNRLSLMHNSIDVTREKIRRKGKYEENLTDKNKLKISSSSVGISSNLKRFIGVLLASVIFAIIYKVSENYSFW